MTVKRYTPTQCCEHDGTYVTYSDYQKLVAENAALKLCTSNQDKAVEHWNSWADEVDKIKSYPETPATDAAIAEIKAHDINLLIDKLSGLPFTIGVSCGYVKEFAANLRAGRKG